MQVHVITIHVKKTVDRIFEIVVVPELAEEYRVVAPVKVRHPALTFSHVVLLRLLSVAGCGNRSALRWRRTRRW